MELRDHPLMSVQGRRSWPPVWVWIGGQPAKHPKGEVGVLKEVRKSLRPPVLSDRLFLIMEEQEALYVGCLLFDDRTFCEWLLAELHNHIGKNIEHIGQLKVDF